METLTEECARAWKADYVNRSNRAALDAMIAEATVDCYNDSECVTGFYTMLDDNLAKPFQTVVLGVDVTATGIDLTEDEQITASARAAGRNRASPSWTCHCLRHYRKARSG